MKSLRALVPFLLVLLGACAVHQTSVQDIDQKITEETQKHWEAHRAIAMAIKSWHVKGKIAVKAGTKGGHATLRWNKNDAGQHIELSGPLGGGRVTIDTDAGGARLRDTRGGDLHGDSVAVLVEQRLGWPLPFDHLPNWLRGLPVAENADIEWDERGRIVRMNDSGWQVAYPEYQDISAGEMINTSVPRQVELNALPGTLRVYDKNGEYLGEDFFIRLIVKSWLP